MSRQEVARSISFADELSRTPPGVGVDILLTDQRMPRRTGVQLLEWAREHAPRTIRLLMTGFSELEDAIEAINRGNVYYYFIKPWRPDDLLQILRNAADKLHLEEKREQLLRQLQDLNPSLRQDRVPDSGFALRLPSGAREKFELSYESYLRR